MHGGVCGEEWQAFFLQVDSNKIGLLFLEIPVALLFDISVVRPLRRLRGINLHLAFISERTKLEDLTG
jgi:hypothetical protein